MRSHPTHPPPAYAPVPFLLLAWDIFGEKLSRLSSGGGGLNEPLSLPSPQFEFPLLRKVFENRLTKTARGQTRMNVHDSWKKSFNDSH